MLFENTEIGHVFTWWFHGNARKACYKKLYKTRLVCTLCAVDIMFSVYRFEQNQKREGTVTVAHTNRNR
jgi:hypothetical protein